MIADGLLVSTIIVTPKDDGKWFEYAGQGALDRVLAGRLPAQRLRKTTQQCWCPRGDSNDFVKPFTGVVKAA